MEGPSAAVEDIDSDLTVSDDDFDPTLPSPDALVRDLERLRPPSDDEPMRINDVIPVVPVVPAPIVVEPRLETSVPRLETSVAPVVPAPAVVEPVRQPVQSPVFSEKDEQKGVVDYLRSCPPNRTGLFDGVHNSDKASVQEAWRHIMNAVRAACALSQRHSNLAKVMFLQAYLSERPLNLFIEQVGQWAQTRELELAKPNPDPKYQSVLPPFDMVCAMLEREFLAGQRQSMYDITETIFNTKLFMLAEKYNVKTLPTLAQIWQDYKALFRERASLVPGEGEFDKATIIFLYLNAIPSNMYNILRHVKDANGQVKEPTDPVMLENSILALGDQFLIDLRKRREHQLGKKPMHSNYKGDGPSGSGPVGNHSHGGKKRPLKSQSHSDRPQKQQHMGGKQPFRPTNTFWNYTDPKTQAFWVRGIGPEKFKEMRGKCLLCNTDSHLLANCPKKEEAFVNKQFYAFNRPKSKS